MAEITWKSILTKLVAGNHLSAGEAWWFVDDLMKGNANPAAVGAVLAAPQLLGARRRRRDGVARRAAGRLRGDDRYGRHRR